MSSLDNLDGAISAMKMRALAGTLLVAAWAAGCSASGGSLSGSSSYGGSAASGGASAYSNDGGIAIRSDAGVKDGAAFEVVPTNLSQDGPTFNWDTLNCVGCGATGGATGGGAGRGSGGASGGGGKAGGGAVAAGGTSSRGGSTGIGGGAASVGGAAAAGGRAGGPTDASAVGSDAAVIPNGGDAAPPDTAADTQATDAWRADSAPACTVQIQAVVPSSLESLKRVVAGPNTQVVLRAQIITGGPGSGVTWNWHGFASNTPVPVAGVGQIDPASAAFRVANAGQTYVFTVSDATGACTASTPPFIAVAANQCGDCDNTVLIRAAPPLAADIPVQGGPLKGGLMGGPPFPQNNIILAKGASVMISPSKGSNIVPSYVRISDLSGGLIVDGETPPSAGGFSSRLLSMNEGGSLLRYNILIVPLDGTDGSTTTSVTAPQLFSNLTTADINRNGFALTGGLTVTGTTLSAAGQPVKDTRLMLTNQDPAAAAQLGQLIFSSVGSSASDGSYVLHVQPGTYWMSISPPVDSGLAEAMTADPVVLTAPSATLGFQWDATTTTTLTMRVVDAGGTPLGGARVRLTSAQATKVGTLTVQTAGGSATLQSAYANVRVEDTTSSPDGVVTFSHLPADTGYDVLVVPGVLGPQATSTTLSLTVPAGGTDRTVQLAPQATISGQLIIDSTAGSSSPDLSAVVIVAYDKSTDAPEAPRSVTASSTGSFALGVTPKRSYVLLAVPPSDSVFARTFVGPGPMQGSEFSIKQKLLSARPWAATVMNESQIGIPGTALQVFCHATWPNCVDDTIPLAETTSGDNGAFHLTLADPASR